MFCEWGVEIPPPCVLELCAVQEGISVFLISYSVQILCFKSCVLSNEIPLPCVLELCVVRGGNVTPAPLTGGPGGRVTRRRVGCPPRHMLATSSPCTHAPCAPNPTGCICTLTLVHASNEPSSLMCYCPSTQTPLLFFISGICSPCCTHAPCAPVADPATSCICTGCWCKSMHAPNAPSCLRFRPSLVLLHPDSIDIFCLLLGFAGPHSKASQLHIHLDSGAKA